MTHPGRRETRATVGALLAGVVADFAGIPTAIVTVAALTLASSGIAAWRLRETAPLRRARQQDTSATKIGGIL